MPEIDEMANILGCDVLLLPTYLGLPLGAKSSSHSIWNPVLEKLNSKLAHGKGNYLSFGGN